MGILLLLNLLNFVISSTATATEMPPKRLLVFGDSISIGSYATYPFTGLLGRYCNLPEENHSVSGTTIGEDIQIGRIRRAQILPTDIVLFGPGINDAYYHRIDKNYLKTYGRLLVEALDKFENSGATAYIGTPLRQLENSGLKYPLNEQQLSALNKDTEAYADVLKRVLARKNYKNVHLVDAREKFLPTMSTMWDPVHPSNIGHQQLFSIYKEALKAHCPATISSSVSTALLLNYVRVKVFFKPWLMPVAVKLGLREPPAK